MLIIRKFLLSKWNPKLKKENIVETVRKVIKKTNKKIGKRPKHI